MENQTNPQKGNLYLIIAIIIGVVAIGAVSFASWKYFGGGSDLKIKILDNIVLSNEIISHLDYMVCKEGLSEDEAVEKWFEN